MFSEAWGLLLFRKNWLWVEIGLLIWIYFLGADLNWLVRLRDSHFLHSFVWKDCVLHHSPGRRAGAVAQNNLFCSWQTLPSATNIHVLIFQPNLATTTSRSLNRTKGGQALGMTRGPLIKTIVNPQSCRTAETFGLSSSLAPGKCGCFWFTKWVNMEHIPQVVLGPHYLQSQPTVIHQIEPSAHRNLIRPVPKHRCSVFNIKSQIPRSCIYVWERSQNYQYPGDVLDLTRVLIWLSGAVLQASTQPIDAVKFTVPGGKSIFFQ